MDDLRLRLSPTLLLGLSRRPLPTQLDGRGARLAPGQSLPARRALALLSHGALAERSGLEAGPLDASTAPPPPPPPHPAYGDAAAALTELLGQWRRLSERAAVGPWLARRGLLYPAPTLVDELARLASRRRLTADDFVALGPRGAYLFPLVERGPYRETSLFSPAGWSRAFAETAPKYALRSREALIGYALGHLGAVGLAEDAKASFRSVFGALLTASDWPADAKAAALVLLRRDRLAAAVAPAALARALPTDEPAAALAERHRYRLIAAAAAADIDYAEGACAKTRHAAAELLARGDSSDPEAPAADQLDALSGACLVLGASATAARLFGSCITDDNRLLRRHPALAVFLDAMDADDFARCVGHFAASSKRGWGDPLIAGWLADATHTLSPADSERLAVDALTSFGYGGEALARRFPLTLHPDTAEVLHAFEERGRGVATSRQLASVLAQAARLDAAYPPLAPPYAT